MEATDLTRLLNSLGLSRYEEVLRANDVDQGTLRQLTDADLRELGFSLGHRRKLLAALRSAAPASDGSFHTEERAGEAETAVPSGQSATAERRQLTVMFCDLVGSTALAAALDPEDMHALLHEYQERCAAVITRLDGFVARSIGDAILAYFGYPRAHENAAEQAARAGLDLIEEVHRLRSLAGAPLQVRIGIASGLVVVSEVAESVSARERAVTGPIINLAARLQQDAGRPDTVIVAAETLRLLRGLFEVEDLGPQTLKGIPEPVRASRIIGERGSETRFDARHRLGATAIVGREGELALLRDRWEQATGGEGQAVLLSGEPGIGKSRLCQALRDDIGDEPHTPILWQCSPFHTNSALHPLIAYVSRAAGFAPNDQPAQKLRKLEHLLARAGGATEERVALLASLLSIDAGGSDPPPAWPQRHKHRMLEALIEHLAALARTQPVLLIVEDAHWIDPTTLDFLTLCVDQLRDARLLLVITFRPGFDHPWSDRAHVTALALNRLGRRQCARMVAHIAAGEGLSEELIDRIVTRTDGIPLFVEELTKTVVESGRQHGEAQDDVPSERVSAQAIPATLHDSLRARLDLLTPPARKVMQIGAALGREFSHELLSAVATPRDGPWEDALLQVIRVGLLHRRGTPPEAVYTFKHALILDVAYASLLRAERAGLHARIAAALVTHFPETVATQPELLAHHLTEAGLAEAAIEQWLEAGRRAAGNSANLEAIGHLTRGLRLLAALPDGAARMRCEMLLQTALGMPLIAVKGYAAKETGATWERVRSLAERLDNAECVMNALYGLWAFHIVGGACVKALPIARKLLDHAARTNDDAMLLVGHRILGVSLHSMGDQPRGRTMIEAALQGYDPSRHRSLAFRFGQDQRVAALAFEALILWLQGFPDQARHVGREAVAYARQIEHANSLGYALAWGACTVAALCGDLEETEQLAAVLVAHAEKNALDMWRAYGATYHAWVTAERGGMEALVSFQDAVTRLKDRGGCLRLPEHLGSLARHLGREGRIDGGLAVVDETLIEVERSGERWCEAELLRVKGVLTLAAHGTAADAAAEELFRRAIAIARRQNAPSWELRAATSLAGLWRDRGRMAEARDLLAPVYGAFTEGFGTADMTAAAQLLAALG